MTRPGDVERWEQTRKNRGHQLPGQSAYGRFTWYDGRLYDLTTHEAIFEVPKARALYYPQNVKQVVTRFFKYAGVFVALGIATSKGARTDSVAPLPPGHPLQWTCRFCNAPLRAAIISNQPEVWCPQCFTEVLELAGFLTRYDEKRKTYELVIPKQ